MIEVRGRRRQGHRAALRLAGLTPARGPAGWIRRGRAAAPLSPSIRWALQAVQIVGGPLGVRRGGEHEPTIVAQHLQPMTDVGGMVVARGQLQTEVGAQERGAELGDQLFAVRPKSRSRRLGWRVQWLLCRRRHNSHDAERRIMPRGRCSGLAPPRASSAIGRHSLDQRASGRLQRSPPQSRSCHLRSGRCK